jgi:hypothetical protein
MSIKIRKVEDLKASGLTVCITFLGITICHG